MDAHEVIIYLLAIIAYFIPFYIALFRNVNGKKLIFWFNLFFAWTLVAWVLLIISSFSLKAKS